MDNGEVWLTVYLALARAGVGLARDEACVTRAHGALLHLTDSGVLSNFERLRVEDGGRSVTVRVSWNRGFLGRDLVFQMSWLTPETADVMEVMTA